MVAMTPLTSFPGSSILSPQGIFIITELPRVPSKAVTHFRKNGLRLWYPMEAKTIDLLIKRRHPTAMFELGT
jgi:hypothetical protein